MGDKMHFEYEEAYNQRTPWPKVEEVEEVEEFFNLEVNRQTDKSSEIITFEGYRFQRSINRRCGS
jgi:hypothetical protein